jgi:hypothetical protein
MGFTLSAICGKDLVLGAPLLLSPHWGHPMEGHRAFLELHRGGDKDVKHEEFAVRAERRLEAVADRLEGEDRSPGTDGEDSKLIAPGRRVGSL